MTNSDQCLRATPILDYNAPEIAALIEQRGWMALPPYDRIGAVYDYVRNEIMFGYNQSDSLRATQVLKDGYGQCNTKATLLLALLRGVGVPCRLHGFKIHKELQRGVVPELVYPLAPPEILHSWVEVETQGTWVKLEGFILDQGFLHVLQKQFSSSKSLCGFGAGTDNLHAPPVAWNGQDTFIQKTGITQDLGLFDDPDSFYDQHRQAFGGIREILYRHGIRHWMNARVRAIREGRMHAGALRLNHAHDAHKQPD